MKEPTPKSEKVERVRAYNVAEHGAELARLVAKITGRKVTGRVEIDLSQGSPGALRTRETVKTAE
jgi:hypothetical protein